MEGKKMAVINFLYDVGTTIYAPIFISGTQIVAYQKGTIISCIYDGQEVFYQLDNKRIIEESVIETAISDEINNRLIIFQTDYLICMLIGGRLRFFYPGVGLQFGCVLDHNIGERFYDDMVCILRDHLSDHVRLPNTNYFWTQVKRNCEYMPFHVAKEHIAEHPYYYLYKKKI